ncbi:DUF6928 family protein [Nocardia cyriacigeorgica]|uniref:Uncharacterized protein n=1 Tax=Nocardia cyriacigeorgica (strain GUH-2) TaxID=1127134 RepID=H6QY27_NOCCG|nr:hypothetical protein [Nocardia cyriacigeorgica]MBF6286055.1 hypothetical protein [Nocardia cyriacigeorgica]CCF61475.1 conserved protein of unknown function [Nocardia cyriacigeorgica GUH-2]
MLSKASSLWYVDASDPQAVLRADHECDPEAARALAEQLHPGNDVVPIMVGTLGGCAGPDADEVYIGCYPGVTVVCSPQVARVRPTALPTPLIRPLASEHTYLIAFDTAHSWGSFAHWERGEFRRSFSANRVHILEDEGLPLVWERSYWAGEHPVRLQVGDMPDPQILPFDPPDFADAANNEWLGFHYRAPAAEGALLPGDISVCGFTLYPKGQAPDPGAPVGESQPHIANGKPRRGLLSWLRRGDPVG